MDKVIMVLRELMVVLVFQYGHISDVHHTCTAHWPNLTHCLGLCGFANCSLFSYCQVVKKDHIKQTLSCDVKLRSGSKSSQNPVIGGCFDIIRADRMMAPEWDTLQS